jgi:hypothetical protein
MSKRPAVSSHPKEQSSWHNDTRTLKQASLTSLFSSSGSAKKPRVSSTATPASTLTPPTVTDIYCDLDGVLVDFERGIQNLFHQPSKQVPASLLWSRLAQTPRFFQDLAWTSDGKALWQALLTAATANSNVALHILTGVPRTKSVIAQKVAWCQRELAASHVILNPVNRAGHKHDHAGEGVMRQSRDKNGNVVVNVITCWTRNKHLESRSGRYVICVCVCAMEMWVDSQPCRLFRRNYTLLA